MGAKDVLLEGAGRGTLPSNRSERAGKMFVKLLLEQGGRGATTSTNDSSLGTMIRQ
jgi:hypothetical protein